jgi:hypothetical protein
MDETVYAYNLFKRTGVEAERLYSNGRNYLLLWTASYE